ncbi:hypothetical protein BGX34_008572 [Mortierella sp. NVP85]|nr:hypothetical protein BGX34_008572 [Mortierella sp. NVP85]
MTEITLFCLLEGTDSFFPVDIERTKTVGHLKDAIKDKKSPSPPKFKDIAADELTLWRVSIPVVNLPALLAPLSDKKKLLDSLPDKTKLEATEDISEGVSGRAAQEDNPPHRPTPSVR